MKEIIEKGGSEAENIVQPAYKSMMHRTVSEHVLYSMEHSSGTGLNYTESINVYLQPIEKRD